MKKTFLLLILCLLSTITMSCENPLYIKNKAVHFRPNIDNLYNVACCGHCPSCKKDKRDNWYVRARFEMCDCLGVNKDMHQVGKRGFILFPTLTYSVEDRPKKTVHIGNVPITIEGFSHKDIHKFTNQITDAIRDKYHLQREDTSLRYLIVSEYGYHETYFRHGKQFVGQNAPHYHGLLFFPSVCSADKEYWKNYVKKIWEKHGHGYLNYSKKFGPYVESAKPLMYTTEYINKQTDWYQREDLNQFLYQDCPPQSEWTDDNRVQFQILVNARKEEIKDIFPNHWQSLHFGESMTTYLKQLPQQQRLNVFQNGICFGDDLNFDGKKNFYSVPFYIFKKLYFDVRKIRVKQDGVERTVVDTEWKNELALNDLRKSYYDNILDSADKLRHRCLEFNIRSKYSDSRVGSWLGKYGLYSTNELWSFISNTLDNFSPEYIVSYKKIRNVAFTGDTDLYLSRLDDESFIDYVADFSMEKSKRKHYLNIWKGAPPYIDWKNKGRSFKRHVKNFHNYRDLQLETFLDVIHRLDIIDSHDRISDYTLRMIEKRTYKQKHLCEYIL